MVYFGFDIPQNSRFFPRKEVRISRKAKLGSHVLRKRRGPSHLPVTRVRTLHSQPFHPDFVFYDHDRGFGSRTTSTEMYGLRCNRELRT